MTPIPRVAYLVSEVAEMLGLSRSSVYRLVRSGEIPSIRYGSSVRIPAWWVEEQRGEGKPGG